MRRMTDQRGSAAGLVAALLGLSAVLYILASTEGMLITGRDVLPRPGKPYHCPHATLFTCGR
jgi:hypothetical protein